MTKRSRLIVAGVLVLIAAGVGAVELFLRAERRAWAAEEGFHAVIVATHAIAEYAESHGGNWPTDWSDLETQAIEDPVVADWAFVRERVEIDFDFDPTQRNDAASAECPVRAIGPVYVYDDICRAMLSRVRAARLRNQTDDDSALQVPTSGATPQA